MRRPEPPGAAADQPDRNTSRGGLGRSASVPDPANDGPTANRFSALVTAELAAPRPVTYHAAENRYRGTVGARERFEELTDRELLVRSTATLKARGIYDPQQHGERNEQPLTAQEHLEVLAIGEVLARYYRHPSQVHHAVTAGATWTQVAEATGSSSDQARRDYREWAAGQHRLWADYQGRFGMSDAEYAAAVQRAAEPEAEAGR